MHISGTPPSLPINCLYVCLVPILASGICFVYSSRHLVCITARHTAFGDICQQHQESSFLQIFYDIIFYGYRIYLAIIYFIHYILLISVNNIGNRAFSWFPADFYAVSCHARCRFGWGMGCWQLYSINNVFKTSFSTFYSQSIDISNLLHCTPCIHAGRDKVHLYDFHLWFTFWSIVKNAVMHLCFCELEHIGM